MPLPLDCMLFMPWCRLGFDGMPLPADAVESSRASGFTFEMCNMEITCDVDRGLTVDIIKFGVLGHARAASGAWMRGAARQAVEARVWVPACARWQRETERHRGPHLDVFIDIVLLEDDGREAHAAAEDG